MRKLFKKTANEYGREESRKTVVINVFSFLTIFSLLLFGTKRLLNGEMTPAIVDYSIMTVALINALILKFAKKITLSAYVMVTLVFILEAAIFAVIGKGGTGIYWLYVYPLLAIFLLGNVAGSIYSLLLITLVGLGLHYEPDFIIQYPDNLLFRVVFTYLLVWISTVVYEYVRYRTRKAFLHMYEQKSNLLEETLQQKEEILTINEKLSEEREIIAKQKDEIEEAHNHIRGSINYAKRLQEAMLTSDELLKGYFSDKYFILFKPKETVSGDFYYINKVNDYLFLSVADCTGHGVSGSFLTILGITYIHEIVRKSDVRDTGKVLNELRNRVKTIFKTFGSENRNGIDLVFCAVNLKTGMMQYSGANNSLFIVRNGELIEYKSTRNPIGFYPKEIDFDVTDIQLQKNDKIYLLTDGLKDQIGGEENKKFGGQKMLSLIKEVSDKPMKEQHAVFDKIIQKWQGDNKQVDDITVMGVEWQ